MPLSLSFKINSVEEEEAVVECYKNSSDFFEKNNISYTVPKQSVKDEYDEKNYRTFLQKAEQGWKTVGKDFLERLTVFFNVSTSFHPTVRITQYGPLGDYSHQNTSVTINRHAYIDPVKIIKHELTHIMIEPYVQKYALSHKQKEYIVETIDNMFDSVSSFAKKRPNLDKN